MSTSSVQRIAGSLTAGFALGGAAAWGLHTIVRNAVVSSPSHVSPAPTAKQGADARPLVFPGPLASAEADAALATYLALPALSAEAPHAELRDRQERLHALLTLLPDSHLPRLLDALASRPGSPEAIIRLAAFKNWTQRDAAAAARWAVVPGADDVIDADTRARFASDAARAWARTDFDAAYAWAGRITDADLARQIGAELLALLAAADPRRALTLAQDGGDARFLGEARRAIFVAWAAQNPAAALRELGPALLQTQNGSGAVTDALAKWAASEPSSALDWALAQPAPAETWRPSLLTQLAWKLDATPAAIGPFIEAVRRREDLRDQAGVVTTLFNSWMRKGSADAIAWIEKLPDAAARSDLIVKSLWQANIARWEDLVRLAHLLPPGSLREEKIAGILEARARQSPVLEAEVIAWLDRNPSPENALAARRVEELLVAGLAKDDPAAAIARWEALPAGADRADLAQKIAVNWAASDSAAASRWLAAQTLAADTPDAAARTILGALQDMAAPWAARDPVAFVAWVETLPAENQRDQLFDTIRHHVVSPGNPDSDDPPSRAAYAAELARIPNPHLRSRLLQDYFRAWRRSDERGARAWFERSGALSPEQTSSLLSESETFL